MNQTDELEEVSRIAREIYIRSVAQFIGEQDALLPSSLSHVFELSVMSARFYVIKMLAFQGEHYPSVRK